MRVHCPVLLGSLVPRLHFPAFFALWKKPCLCFFVFFLKCKKHWAMEPGNEATSWYNQLLVIFFMLCKDAGQWDQGEQSELVRTLHLLVLMHVNISFFPMYSDISHLRDMYP